MKRYRILDYNGIGWLIAAILFGFLPVIVFAIGIMLM